MFRSIRLRYRVENEESEAFEVRVRELLEAHGCAVSDFRDFQFLEDYAGSRYLDQARAALKPERAEFMGQFLFAATRLFMHGLVGPDADGRFSQERNDNREQNPVGSRFESVHHLFCNMVAAELPVFVRTPWMGSPVGVVVTF